MRCLSCRRFSFKVLCKNCLDFVVLRRTCRDLKGFKVYGFFDYDSISFLLHSKYSVLGSKIYKELSRLVLEDLQTKEIAYNAYGVGIDDRISKQGYAHNAIFLHSLKGVGLKPMYRTLYLSNNIRYAGKSLKFREKNPREFILKREVKDREIVLVDDIVTSGLTLLSAKEFLEKHGAKVLYALVLADANTS
ncbi:ComF family protein [Helicobacter winghamensis]|uniref:Transformation system protein n=1 Tax=Helicobacter winghamensis TaxID=157268 RepID=A0A2N3PJY1_9HELI|nr:phosphoribosyltransferase family protein [Helicobacter winghamensis]EEO26305.1 phosphoribosyl transferase domain protein [Helicobacter winghamensis ATCC BAA-430]PKT77293.1 transformation system protein [Helicobacter winghamensis]PKT77493.1 transformation system protein [Helicobacter winghamensis]PKT77774.1 transformation system protein [Helicobacter winghamensis]PKT81459.1 transformation system protein [Helicobacter winghamensis]